MISLRFAYNPSFINAASAATSARRSHADKYAGVSLSAEEQELDEMGRDLHLNPQPPEATFKGILAELARKLWFAAEGYMDCGSMMGDHGWQSRGENPADVGRVGIGMRNVAEAMLSEDFDYAIEELHTVSYAGETYLDAQQFQGLLGLLTDDEGYGDPTAPVEKWPAAVESLRSLAQGSYDIADRLKQDETSADPMLRTAGVLEKAAELFEKQSNSVPDAKPLLAESFAVLGIDPTSSKHDITEAYHKGALKCHPDTHPGEEGKEAQFRTLTKAYEAIKEEVF